MKKRLNVLQEAADILRNEVTTNDKWKIIGYASLIEFQPPSMLNSFLRWLLIGTKKTKMLKGNVMKIPKSQ